ncbi:MAG: hypothetical protein JO006_12755 [Paucibacter sp.]|nr:hypothetical protein [Roseateles sp.]
MSSVVILDDNVPIRELLAEWLAGDGHLVFDAPRLRAAMTSEIDVVLIDLPQLREGARAAIGPVRSRFARAALVGMSTQLGASLPHPSAVAADLGLQALLAKPCERLELLGLMRTLERQ